MNPPKGCAHYSNTIAHSNVSSVLISYDEWTRELVVQVCGTWSFEFRIPEVAVSLAIAQCRFGERTLRFNTQAALSEGGSRFDMDRLAQNIAAAFSGLAGPVPTKKQTPPVVRQQADDEEVARLHRLRQHRYDDNDGA